LSLAGFSSPSRLVNPVSFRLSVVRCGNRKKQNQAEWIPCILESDESSKERRKNWARLIQKVYEVDLLTCPKCFGKMKAISVIEDEEVIKKILKHLGLWDKKARPPPKATSPPNIQEYKIDCSRLDAIIGAA
jgi:hypothetical protein